MSDNPIVGIDVSKLKFDVCLLKGQVEKFETFSNDSAGFLELEKWLKKNKVKTVEACMESTGPYWQELAEYLHNAGNIVSVVNPTKIKGFRQSELKRSKTDKIDAGLIARYYRALKPAPWTPMPKEIQTLQHLERHLDTLKGLRASEKTRLKNLPDSELLAAYINAHIAFLDQQIASVERAIKQQIKTHPKLQQQYNLITSIIGVKDVTATVFLGEIGYHERFSNTREIETFCGLNPRVFQSGTSVSKQSRISKVGNARVRKALYMPALAAMYFNPQLRDFAARLSAQGKPKRVVIVAVMRKMLRIICGVLKSGRPYQAEYCSEMPQLMRV
ncbi:MAG: IS110 family transposase [Candidatus Competibacteraceae bacterium]|nr:IS110 family transposase [Candidatus Competibacteraceae bacterium]